ncbi:uncharacterized protein DUF4263 [Bacillus sp. BK006]|nr:uncharacterized protein DUF4263 [Bacillus sp. BK006]
MNTEINRTVVEKFIKEFIKEISEYQKLFGDLGLNIRDYVPEIFANPNLGVNTIYSKSKKQLLIVFNKREKFHFLYNEVSGQVMDFYDRHGLWPKNQTGFNIQDSYVNIKNSRINGMRPFTLRGNDYEMSLEGLTFDAPGFGEIHFDYAFIFSHDNFIKISNDTRLFLTKIMSVIKEYKNQKTDSPVLYKKYLESLKMKMEDIFFDESIPELEIDKFIEMNPVILELGLQLTRPISQVKLKNILNKYPHDLRPDLIAFDNRVRNWTIVDYKKAKKSLVKNVGAVRTGFRAEVYSLKDQLRDYVRYFEENDHREEFKKDYKVEIKKPRAIGIIGNVNANEQEEFEDLIMEEFNQKYNIIPYNYLYNNFCESVDIALKFVK